MISRQWCGLAYANQAQNYVEHLRHHTFPTLREIPGFVDTSILSRTAVSDGHTRLTLWQVDRSLDVQPSNRPTVQSEKERWFASFGDRGRERAAANGDRREVEGAA